MINPRYFLGMLLFVFALTGGCSVQDQGKPATTLTLSTQAPPRIVGAMHNVMWKGERFARIDFDTLQQRAHLYALGPLEDLRGEFVIIDGHAYSARVQHQGIQIDSSFSIRAPFAGYAYIPKWKPAEWPDSVRTLPQIDTYFDQHIRSDSEPFFFRLRAIVDSATYHVMALPAGSDPKTPDEVHDQGRVYFQTTNQNVEILGFYSTQHQGIFTHHSTHSHLHLLSLDRKHLGHLDHVVLQTGSVELFIPAHVHLK